MSQQGQGSLPDLSQLMSPEAQASMPQMSQGWPEKTASISQALSNFLSKFVRNKAGSEVKNLMGLEPPEWGKVNPTDYATDTAKDVLEKVVAKLPPPEVLPSKTTTPIVSSLPTLSTAPVGSSL
jgi:hypothetical protein